MKKVSKKQREINLERAVELLYTEHPCDDSTCSIAHAQSVDADALAVDLFAGTGAGSEEFYEAMQDLPKDFDQRVEKERDLLGPTKRCPTCNAETWDIDNFMDKELNLVYCTNCGTDFSTLIKIDEV